jgi:hypothetical protein
MFLTTVHFVEKWFGSTNFLFFFGFGGEPKDDWARGHSASSCSALSSWRWGSFSAPPRA